MPAAKPLTTDELARMTARGFHDVVDRLGKKMDEGFSGMNHKFEGAFAQLNLRIDKLERRVDRLEATLKSKVEYLDRRIDAVLDEVAEVKALVEKAATREQVRALERRVVVLERTVGLAR